jgi:hypothetical protein
MVERETFCAVMASLGLKVTSHRSIGIMGIRWTGHVEENISNAKTVSEDNIKYDLKDMRRSGMEWLEVAQDGQVIGFCKHG